MPNNGGILTNAKLELVFAHYQISFCSTALHDFWLERKKKKTFNDSLPTMVTRMTTNLLNPCGFNKGRGISKIYLKEKKMQAAASRYMPQWWLKWPKYSFFSSYICSNVRPLTPLWPLLLPPPPKKILKKKQKTLSYPLVLVHSYIYIYI